MAQLYQSAGESNRASIAAAFYGLGWKSPDAKRVLTPDVHIANQALRIQVQYALGRVSSDADVVDVLLDNMQNDANPLFRDKAACALAYDQIHLTEREKVRLYDGLIRALSDSKLDVRSIAALALSIQTGQTKGFDANADAGRRDAWSRMAEMARRVSIALVALASVLLHAQHARAQSPSILARSSSDDSSVDTGPDTFAIFQNAKGSVRLSWSDHFSGYRSIEIRDVSGDRDFPELQGYFPLRSHGTIYLHFALMIANPAEELAISRWPARRDCPAPERHRLLAQDARRLSVPVLGQHAEEAVHAAAVRVVHRGRRVPISIAVRTT